MLTISKNIRLIFIAICILISFVFSQCKLSRIHHQNKAESIYRKYNGNTKKDTLLLDKGFICIYKKTHLSEYGKYKNCKKKGKWYIFDKFGIEKIVVFKSDSEKIIYKRSNDLPGLKFL